MNILLSQSHASLQDNEFIRDRDISPAEGFKFIEASFHSPSLFDPRFQIEITTGLS